ncbi:hypothetical protein AB4587_07285, partial [Vibrio breoganii]
MKLFKGIISFPVYFFIIPIIFPLKFFIDNFYLFDIKEFITYCLFVMVFSLAIFFLSKVKRLKLLSVSICLMTIPLSAPGLSYKLGFVLLLLFILLCYLIIRSNNNTHLPTVLLNTFSIVMLCIQILNLSTYFIRNENSVEKKIVLSDRPNIYHFVLDGYSNKNTLSKYYKFENDLFLNQLVGKGFNIHNNAVSPYNQTLPIISSIFNMRYSIKNGSSYSNFDTKKLMYNWGSSPYTGIVPTILKENDYDFIFTPSGYSFIKFPDSISTNKSNNRLTPDANYFIIEYMRSLWWSKHLKTSKTTGLYDITTSAFDDKTYVDSTSPIFYYSHILSPHPPFNINEKGELIAKYKQFSTIDDGSHATKMDDKLIDSYKLGYIEKLKFTNQSMINKINHILEHDLNKKIIIIQ